VAGIIAAARDGLRVQGVAYDAELAAFRLPPEGTSFLENDIGLGLAIQDAVDRGVRIMNNSWGWDFYIGDGFSKAEILEGLPGQIAAFRNMAAADGIMIFSTGNEEQAQPNLQSGMPFYVPELQAHWLAVTAVGPTGEIASYANHCGLAAEWCLAAPGGEVTTGDFGDQIVSDGTNGGLGGSGLDIKAGTSMAAPHVTGAVAIARQMFPNAPASGLTRLVLATATDLGETGLDDVYGWGLLNLENMASVLDAEAGSVFANGAWAADEGQSALIETLTGRLIAGGPAGAWASVLGAHGEHDATPDAYGADADTFGVVAGYDMAATETTRIGAALSMTRTDFDEDGLDNGGRVDALTLSGYAAARKGVLFADASAGVSYR
ncbi:MAG: autotransporter domain-containing protein, partial [Brevundimonas sp.]